MKLQVSVLLGPFAVCKLPSELWPAPPVWCDGFVALVRESSNWTMVCLEDAVPETATVEGGWVAIVLEGTFDFGLTAVLVSILNPLAEAKVGIFALSTFDTDWVLIKASHLDLARSALQAAGHVFRE